MLPPSIDRSEFNSQTYLAEPVPRYDADYAYRQSHSRVLSRSRPSAARASPSLRAESRHISPPLPQCESGEIHSYSPSPSHDSMRRRQHTPSPSYGIVAPDGTVATPSPYSESSRLGSQLRSSEGRDTFEDFTHGTNLNHQGTSRPSPSVPHRRGHLPPPPVEHTKLRRSPRRSLPPPQAEESAAPKPEPTFEQMYRKYLMDPVEQAKRVGTVARQHPYDRSTALLAAPSSTSSVASGARYGAKYVPGAASKRYLATPHSTSRTANACTPPQPSKQTAPFYHSTPTSSASTRSVSEQSNYSNHSKAAAAISKWRKVLYAGPSHVDPVTTGGAKELDGEYRPELMSPCGQSADSRSLSSASLGINRDNKAVALLENEERRAKRYFESDLRPKGDVDGAGEWGVMSARELAGRLREGGKPVRGELTAAALHRNEQLAAPSLSTNARTNQGALGTSYWRQAADQPHSQPAHAEGSGSPRCVLDGLDPNECFDDDVPSLPCSRLSQRKNVNAPDLSVGMLGKAALGRSMVSPAPDSIDEDNGALVVTPEAEALMLEVQQTREKAENLARHLVRTLEEKRQLQIALAQKETEKTAAPLSDGLHAALRTKEKEMQIYEEEIDRLQGLLQQKQATLPAGMSAEAAAEAQKAVQQALLSQRKAEERSTQLASELESAVGVICSLDGRVAELQKGVVANQLGEIKSRRSQERCEEGVNDQQALIALIHQAESLLHASDANSSHTAVYLASLQSTCHDLRRQLEERGGVVDDLRRECTELHRDKEILRLYGAQWLQQLQDVKADAEVIAEIVRTAKSDAEQVVADSIHTDSVLTASAESMEASITQTIQDYNASSRQFASIVIQDMKAVARYLSALRRMNIGEKEGFMMLERLASGKPLLLLEEDEDGGEEPSLGTLAEPARELLEQKKQFVYDAVKEAIQPSPKKTAEELVVLRPAPAVDPREASPAPVLQEKANPSVSRPSGSVSLQRERSTTAKPASLGRVGPSKGVQPPPQRPVPSSALTVVTSHEVGKRVRMIEDGPAGAAALPQLQRSQRTPTSNASLPPSPAPVHDPRPRGARLSGVAPERTRLAPEPTPHAADAARGRPSASQAAPSAAPISAAETAGAPPPAAPTAPAGPSASQPSEGSAIPPSIRRRMEEPQRSGVDALPPPASGNPFEKMNLQPAPSLSVPGSKPVGEEAPRPAASTESRTTPIASFLAPDLLENDRASLRLPPRPYTKPISAPKALAQSRQLTYAGLRTSNAPSSLASFDQSSTVPTTTATNLSSIMPCVNGRSNSELSSNAINIKDDSSTDLQSLNKPKAIVESLHSSAEQRKESVAKILERLRTSKN